MDKIKLWNGNTIRNNYKLKLNLMLMLHCLHKIFTYKTSNFHIRYKFLCLNIQEQRMRSCITYLVHIKANKLIRRAVLGLDDHLFGKEKWARVWKSSDIWNLNRKYKSDPDIFIIRFCNPSLWIHICQTLIDTYY